MASTLITLASEVSHESAGMGPYIIGVGTFLILMALLGALMAFGGGREHS